MWRTRLLVVLGFNSVSALAAGVGVIGGGPGCRTAISRTPGSTQIAYGLTGLAQIGFTAAWLGLFHRHPEDYPRA